ncbi:hypothetical protein D3C81_336170 [compost metagenome]
MAEIIATLEPGAYTGGRSVTIQFPAGARKAIITRDDRAPVLTEILAYDTGHILPIPSNSDTSGDGPIVERPFLAATQDGRGNVIYDGGFPKFYNIQIANANGGSWPATRPTTLAGLPGACKYLLNALSFIANPRKTAQGNRKILFLNNLVRGSIYNVFGSHYNPDPLQLPTDGAKFGFRDTFDAVCQIGGWIPTYYDLTTQGSGVLEVGLPYLDTFAAVVYLASGSVTPATSAISETTASNLAQYRAAGNGLAIITDHCPDNFTSIADAELRGGYFGYDATKVAKYFGAYFSGDVFRQPVQVEEIRRQIGLPGPPGDHPLLAGMLDSEFIYAGGSESMIVPELYPDDVVDPDTDWTLNMATAGTYRVNVLVQLDDGEIITRPLKYTIIDPPDVTIADSLNTNISGTATTFKRGFDLRMKSLSVGSITLKGEIQRNGVLQGYFSSTDDVNTYHLFAGVDRGMPIANGDTMVMYIKEPFEFKLTTVVTLTDPAPIKAASGSYPQFLKALRAIPMYAGKTDAVILADVQQFSDVNHASETTRGINLSSHIWRTMQKARLPFRGDTVLSPCKLWMATDAADWTANKPTGPTPGTAAIVATTNDVYYWDDLPMLWVLHPQKADVLFGYQRAVINTRNTTETWLIGNTTAVKQ